MKYERENIHTLKLNFVLNNQGLVLRVNSLGELGGDGVVRSLVLDDQALVTLHALEDGGLLNGPLANVGPLLLLLALGVLHILLGMRRLPAGLPVICELFEERGLEGGGLRNNGSTWRCLGN